MAVNELKPGWGLPPPGARKSHYFVTGKTESLCRRHGLYTGPREDFAHESPDNCAECKRRLKRLQEASREAA